MDKRKALETIFQAVKKPYHLQSDSHYGQPKVYLNDHPFVSDYIESVDFYGFGSDDIFPFIYAFLKNHTTEPKFIFWLCPLKQDNEKHNIYAEFDIENFSSSLVSGMTDYSGSGGSAYKDLKNVFEFLEDIYDTTVEYRETEPGYDDIVSQSINKQWKEQLEEE
jgi:hypothetical protein